MKRIFAFALAAGIVTGTSGVVLAQAGPGAPQQNPMSPSAAPSNPGASLGLNQNVIGDQAPQQNLVQDGQNRDTLGGLVSGNGVAPSVGGAPAVAGGAAPVAGGSATTVVSGQQAVVSGQQTVVASQAAVVAQPALSIHEQHFNVARIMHHCMNRTMHDRFMAGQPPVMRMGFGPAPFPFFGAPIGDLELNGVGMIADGAGDKGPLYRVTFTNNSRFIARNFQVSLVAVLGQINFESPVVTVEIPEVAAGAVGTIDIQFPAGVMSMGPTGQPGPFETLIAAIDSFSEMIETNELNNITTLTRVDVAVIETTAATTETTTTVTTGTAVAPAAVAPVAGAPAAVAPAAVAPAAPAPVDGGAAVAPEQVPAPAPAPAPESNSDLDKIPLDSVEGTSDLFSK